MEQRLVNVAQPEPERCERVQDLFCDPARVTDFNNQRVFLEALLECPKILSALRFILEGPGELNEDGAQPVCFGDRCNSRFVVSLVGRLRLSLMSERMVQLRGKAKVGIVADAVHPFPRCRRLWRTVI